VVGLGPRPHDFPNDYRSFGARLGPIRGVNSALTAFEMRAKISTFHFLPRVNKQRRLSLRLRLYRRRCRGMGTYALP